MAHLFERFVLRDLTLPPSGCAGQSRRTTVTPEAGGLQPERPSLDINRLPKAA
jgi:hypothetical protein